MYILGLGGSLHDFSACLMRDDEILVAIEEERITRQKHAVNIKELESAIVNNQLWKFMQRVPNNTLKASVEYCLEYAGIDYEDIDLVVTTDSNTYLPVVNSFQHMVITNHHMSHIASAYYASGYEEAAVLVVDGRGSKVSYNNKTGYESVTLAHARGNKIEILDKVLEHSIGHFYSAITMAVGFGILEDGKTMGLASYGTDTYLGEMNKCYCIKDGRVEFLWSLDEVKSFITNKLKDVDEDNLFQARADMAYAAQKLIEDMVCYYADRLYKETGCDKLCIAGGVALNSVANGVVYKRLNFSEIFIPPAAGDNGLAFGCALYGTNYLCRGGKQ